MTVEDMKEHAESGFVKLAEAESHTGLPKAQLRALCRAGALVSMRRGKGPTGTLYISRLSLTQFLAEELVRQQEAGVA